MGSERFQKWNPVICFALLQLSVCQVQGWEGHPMLHPPCTHDARVPGQGGCRTWSDGSLPNPSPVSEDILLSTQLRLREPCCGCTSSCAARGCPAPSSPSPGPEPATRCAITQSGITTTSEVSPGDSQEIEFVIRFLFGKSSVLFHAERLWPLSHDRAAGSPKPKHKLVSFMPKLPQGPHSLGC